MNLLKAVAILRTEKSISMVSMAKELNVSRDTIYKTLSSKKTALTNSTLHGICKCLGVTLSELIRLAEKYTDESNEGE